MNRLFHLIHVFHLRVDQILFAVIIMEFLHVLVYQIILAGRQIAAQNVQLMPNVLEISLVLTKNAETRVPAHVVYTQRVIQWNMYHSVLVKMVILETHLMDVTSYNKVMKLIINICWI